LIVDKQQELEQIAKLVSQCQKCPLYKHATKAVPGAGSAEAEIFFVGEGPGYHEDQQGLPFVGAAGKLLDTMLKEIGLKREDVFIGNMVKHRPPNNRDPEPAELAACMPWLDQQLAIIRPKMIVTLGRFSMAKFIPDGKISRVHGQARFVTFQDQKVLVVPFFHPAAALRNGNVMSQFREDFLKLPQLLERFKRLEAQMPVGASPEEAEEPADTEQMSLL
jgi:DNA polymerase